MLKEALASTDLALGPTIALVIFAVFMLLVGLWLLRPGASRRYQFLSASALDDESSCTQKPEGHP